MTDRIIKIPRFVIAAASSGSGKTTVATGIAAAITRRGLAVQPYKCGPDYIDPGYLAAASGKPCHNLDRWMLEPEDMVELFQYTARRSEIAAIEGVMGLFDGRDSDSGSTADIAILLNAPVILVINIAKMAESAAAIALGFKNYDPHLNLAGVIFNQVGSPRHLKMAKDNVEKTGVPVLGYLPRDESIAIAERHLGLTTAVEKGDLEFMDPLTSQIETSIDLDAVIDVGYEAPYLEAVQPHLFPDCQEKISTSLAIAYDEAFSFYYQANFDLLTARGVELKFFSPLRDSSLPQGVSGLYIGGGYPEVYARQLDANKGMKLAIRQAAADGMPIYAECGGLMYLSEAIADFDGAEYGMVGVLGGKAVMQKSLERLGYARAEALRSSILAAPGEQLKGHIFHWSRLPGPEASCAAYHLVQPNDSCEGFITGPANNVLASYLHLHFGGNLAQLERFIASLRRWQANIG